MPQWLDVATCAAGAALYWTLLGLWLGRTLLPGPLAMGFAPILGFAVHSAVALPVHTLIGLSPLAIWAVAGLLLVLTFLISAAAGKITENGDGLPAWCCPGAALIAALVAAAVMPKSGGTIVASAIFDHTKVAIVDEIARLGLPPGNPFFAAQGPRLPYYYLWHASVALVARAAGVTGWTAAAALTGVTAFASLLAMVGLAVWWRGAKAAAWVLLLALTASLRPLIELAVPRPTLDAWFLEASGLGSWLFQAAWVPQHLAAATCVLLAAVLIGRLAHSPRPLGVLVLGLVAATAVQSSTYVGGVTFGLAAPVAAVLLLRRMTERRLAFCLAAGAAALVALVLAAPLLRDQLAATAARELGSPIALAPTEVFGPAIPEPLRRLLDLPGFWLVYLVVELPAIYLTGAWMLRRLWHAPDDPARHLVNVALASLVVAGLLISWLLASTFGNNDLGWRATLPPILVLMAAAAAALTGLLSRRAAAVALGLVLLGLPAGAITVHTYVTGNSPRSDVFAQTPAMWEAVRAHTPPTARVVNNPLFLREMTPWRGNISWALLANRRSCYAGEELVLAFVPLPHAQRRYIEGQFVRLFSGEMPPEDVSALLARHRCEAVVLTAQDSAWARDPFPAAGYRLAASQPDAWRIYLRVDVASREAQ